MMRGIAELQQQEIKAVDWYFHGSDRRGTRSVGSLEQARTAHWLMGNFPASLADIRETVKREPRHFGAYSVLGMIRAEMGENARAVAASELARKWNPHIVGLDSEIKRLKALGGDAGSGRGPLGLWASWPPQLVGSDRVRSPSASRATIISRHALPMCGVGGASAVRPRCSSTARVTGRPLQRASRLRGLRS